MTHMNSYIQCIISWHLGTFLVLVLFRTRHGDLAVEGVGCPCRTWRYHRRSPWSCRRWPCVQNLVGRSGGGSRGFSPSWLRSFQFSLSSVTFCHTRPWYDNIVRHTMIYEYYILYSAGCWHWLWPSKCRSPHYMDDRPMCMVRQVGYLWNRAMTWKLKAVCLSIWILSFCIMLYHAASPSFSTSPYILMGT